MCICVSTPFPCGLHVSTHSPCGPLTTNYIWLICGLLCHRRTLMSHCVRRAPSQRHPHPLHHPHLLPKEHHSLPKAAVQLLSVTTLLSLLCHQMQQGRTCGKQCRYSVFSQTLRMLGHLQVATDRHAMTIHSQPHADLVDSCVDWISEMQYTAQQIHKDVCTLIFMSLSIVVSWNANFINEFHTTLVEIQYVTL